MHPEAPVTTCRTSEVAGILSRPSPVAEIITVINQFFLVSKSTSELLPWSEDG